MAWRLERGEALDKGFRRVAGDEIARVRMALADPELGREQAIHLARRSFKRLRALVRLAKPALGDAFAPADKRWRDAGRLLASSRDATVLVETFDKIVERNPEDLPAAPLARLRTLVSKATLPEDIAQTTRHIQEVLAMLDVAQAEADGLSWPSDADEVGHGLKKSQARLKRAWKAARDDPQPGNLHAWRKRVKDYTAQTKFSCAPRFRMA